MLGEISRSSTMKAWLLKFEVELRAFEQPAIQYRNPIFCLKEMRRDSPQSYVERPRG